MLLRCLSQHRSRDQELFSVPVSGGMVSFARCNVYSEYLAEFMMLSFVSYR